MEPTVLEDETPLLPELSPLPDYEKPLTPRYKELARLLSLGKTDKEIRQVLGYGQTRLAMLKNSPAIKQHISILQERMYEKGTDERIKILSGPAMDVIEEALTSDKMELKDKVMQARWLIEKVSGKPAQQVDHKGNISVGVFLDKLDTLIDVAPKASSTEVEEPEEENDSHAKWLDKNL